ncbi:RidA family protein [Caulobacter vibrioides]|uniref:RidA family protein n=1 Tax=Caulobacter vibrioides TaxID=155892 RepID=A0A290MHH5_CAUVI|nr:RidA family protein [Caulobacter vibrioides]ATC31458.1 RidA family protein [Caulobacter vibrioides]
MFRRCLAPILCALIATPSLAQTTYPKSIAAPGGEVVIPSAAHQGSYDAIKYAPARRVGDTLYVSGVIVGRGKDEGTDPESFKRQIRRAFVSLDEILKASGTNFENVVMINSFHVWEGPDQPAPRFEQINMINAVKSEFIKGAHPAWTAVGTTGLLSPGAIIEIQLIAYVPPKKP